MDPLCFSTTYLQNSSSDALSNDKRGGPVETKKKTSFIARIFKRNKPEVEATKILAKKVTFSSTVQVFNYEPEVSKNTSDKVQKAVEKLPLLLAPSTLSTIIPVCKPSWNRTTLAADLESRVIGKNVLKRKETFLMPILIVTLRDYLRANPQNFDEAVHHIPDLMLKDHDFALSLLKRDFDLSYSKVKDHLEDMGDIDFSDAESELLTHYLNVSNDKSNGLSIRQKRIAIIYNEFAYANSRISPFEKLDVSSTLQSALKAADQNERFSLIASNGLEMLNEPHLTHEEKTYLCELSEVLSENKGQEALNTLLSQPLNIGQLKTLIKMGNELYSAKEGKLPDPALIEGNKRRGDLGVKGYFIALSSAGPPKLYLTSEVLGMGSSKKVKTAFYLNENKLVSLSEVNMRAIKGKYVSIKERKAKSLSRSSEFKREQEKLMTIHAAIKGKAYVIEPSEVLSMTGKPSIMVSERYNSAGISEDIINAHIDIKILIMHAWAAGLSQIHAGGFVHSDFKPENTLIKGDINNPDQEFKVVITDLGLAVKKMAEIRGGSFLYSAPETKQKKSPRASPTADAWSLGISMIEILLPVSRHKVSKEYEIALFIITQATPETPQLLVDTQFEIVRSLLMRDNADPSQVSLIMDEAKRLLMIDPEQRELSKVLKNLERMTH